MTEYVVTSPAPPLWRVVVWAVAGLIADRAGRVCTWAELPVVVELSGVSGE